jgi:hypothetical protein
MWACAADGFVAAYVKCLWVCVLCLSTAVGFVSCLQQITFQLQQAVVHILLWIGRRKGMQSNYIKKKGRNKRKNKVTEIPSLNE